MSDLVAYRSAVKVERLRGPLRRATLPGEDQPVHFCVHGAIAEHYGVDPASLPRHAATLDYIVASTAG